MTIHLAQPPQPSDALVIHERKEPSAWEVDDSSWVIVSANGPTAHVLGGHVLATSGSVSAPAFGEGLTVDEFDDEPLSEATASKLRRAIADFASGNIIERPLKPPSR